MCWFLGHLISEDRNCFRQRLIVTVITANNNYMHILAVIIGEYLVTNNY